MIVGMEEEREMHGSSHLVEFEKIDIYLLTPPLSRKQENK
jgi:hypothetical protein